MNTFDVRLVEEFDTRQKVSKLVRNGRCLVDEFIENVKANKNIAPELDELVATIEDVANGKMTPPNRYKKLKLSSKLSHSIYEAKSKHLRLYLFHEKETGQIHILGGQKGDQDEDIRRVEQIVKEYSVYQKQKKSC